MTDSEDSNVLNNNEKNEDETESSPKKQDENEDKSSENEKSEEKQEDVVEKREKPETESDEEDTKRKKTDNSPERSFLDIVNSFVKDNLNSSDKFNLLTNTKEYDCPIAKLAKMKPETGLFGIPKSEKSDENKSEPVTATEPTEPSEETKEPETNQNEIFLEPSMSENEKLLQETVRITYHIINYQNVQKKCKLSMFKNSEWTVPVPVVTHLILNKDSSNKRVVCFQFGTGRLLLNTVLLPSMSFNKLKNKSIIFIGQSIGKNIKKLKLKLGDSTIFIPHRLTFTDSNLRDEFHELYYK